MHAAMPTAGPLMAVQAVAGGAVGSSAHGRVESWGVGQQHRLQYDATAAPMFDPSLGAMTAVAQGTEAVASIPMAAQAQWELPSAMWQGTMPSDGGGVAVALAAQRNALVGQAYQQRMGYQLPQHPQDPSIPYLGADSPYVDSGDGSMHAMALLGTDAAAGKTQRAHQLPMALQQPRPPLPHHMPQMMPAMHQQHNMAQALAMQQRMMPAQPLPQQLQQPYQYHLPSQMTPQMQAQHMQQMQMQQAMQAQAQAHAQAQMQMQAHQAALAPMQHQPMQVAEQPQTQDKSQQQQQRFDPNAKDPVLPPGVPTVGSLEHTAGICRPCFYIHSRTGCLFGTSCKFCHGDHPKMIRVRPTKLKRSECKALARRIFHARGGNGGPNGVASGVMEKAEAELLESKELQDADDVTLRYALMVLHALYKEVALPP